MNDVFDDLLAGPNATRTYTLRDGRSVIIRAGTRAERNRIEGKMGKENAIMDGVALFMFLRAANPDGTRRFVDQKFAEFAETLDYDLAVEIAMQARRAEEAEDEISLDARVAVQAKN